MKKNVLHSHHLTENKAETRLGFSFVNVTEYDTFAAVKKCLILKFYLLNYHILFYFSLHKLHILVYISGISHYYL